MKAARQPLGDGDGPLIWFPLNWNYRFANPISYWEVDYGGGTFVVFELTLNSALLAAHPQAVSGRVRRAPPA